MAKSLTQIQKQIARLQQEANSLKSRESKGVIARIKEAVVHYGLTKADIFGGSTSAQNGSAKLRGRKAASGKKAPLPPKYRSESGQTWSGHGKRPNWFKDALARGKVADDLLVK